MNDAKKWWSNTDNADSWIAQNSRYTLKGSDILLDEIRKAFPNGAKVLEVGSGDGINIGRLSQDIKYQCSCIDVNSGLLAHVKRKYPNVETIVRDISDIRLPRKSFDIVFTRQVLQHVHPSEVTNAIQQLVNVGKEVWMWEGIGRVNYKHGDNTHKAHGGSWFYDIPAMVECYEIKSPEGFDREKLYKHRS